jgi:hypothetical protein
MEDAEKEEEAEKTWILVWRTYGSGGFGFRLT